MRSPLPAIAVIIVCAAAAHSDAARAQQPGQQPPAPGPIPRPLSRPCPGGTPQGELHTYSECNATDHLWHVVTDQSYLCPNTPPPSILRVRVADQATDQRCDDQPIDPNGPPRTRQVTAQDFPQERFDDPGTHTGTRTFRECRNGVWWNVTYDQYRARDGRILLDRSRPREQVNTGEPCVQPPPQQPNVIRPPAGTVLPNRNLQIAPGGVDRRTSQAGPGGSTPVFTLEPTETARDQRTAASLGPLINIVAYADAINAVNVSGGMLSLDQKIGVGESPQHARNDGSEVIEISGAVDAAPTPLVRRMNAAMDRLLGLLRPPAYHADAALIARTSRPTRSRGVSRFDSDQTVASASPIQLLFRSLGGSAGEILEMQVFKNGPGPVRLEGLEVVLEPLKENATRQITNELQKRAAKAVQTIRLNGYCLEFLKAPPSPGTMFRIAPQAIQQQFAPMRKIMSATRRVHNAGHLNPDSNPTSYFHSIRQWAIWTTEQRLDQDGFKRRFIEHTRKNVLAAGRPWSKDLEGLVEKTVPNRWNDIGKVLNAARSAAGGGPDAR